MKITGLVEIWGKLAEPKTLPLKWRIVFVTVAFIGAVACVSLGYDTPAPLALDLLFLTVFCALFIYGSIVALGIAFGSAAILPVLSALLLLVNVMHIDLRQKGWAQWITGVLVTLGVYYGSNWWEKPLKRILARLRRVHRLLPHMVALLISFSSLWVLGKFALPFREGTAGIDFDSKIPSVKVSVSPQAISAYEQAAQNLADIMEQSEDDE